MLLGALLVYAALVLAVGALAARGRGRSPEEFFLAGRGLGRVVLFMSLFGTNTTPFVLIGIPALAWSQGVGVFGLNAPIIALVIPLTFLWIGRPARHMGARLGALTPTELVARRLDAPWLGRALFALFVVYTVPYMVSAVKGAGTALSAASEGALSTGSAGALVLGVALVYTSIGGMRATAWTNVLQGALFLGFMLAALVLVARSMGGFGHAMQRLADERPELLVLGDRPRFALRAWSSYALSISLTVIAFPHMLVRLMAARGDAALRGVCRVYPVALVALWLPAVLLGAWGALEFPGLENPDLVFPSMTAAHLPPALAALGVVAVIAAVMSTLDAQILTLSSMLARDVLDPLRARRAARSDAPTPPAQDDDVRSTRLFALLLAAVVWALAQTWGAGVFEVARFAFDGYVTLVPTLFACVRWRRFNAAGAFCSLAAGSAVLLTLRFGDGLPPLGFLPVFWAFAAAGLGAWAGSLLAPPPRDELVRSAFERTAD